MAIHFKGTERAELVLLAVWMSATGGACSLGAGE
jgi:hypothetical protein